MSEQQLQQHPLHLPSLGKRALIGAIIALVLISAFLLAAGEGNPAWGKYWYIRPLVIVPLAGAAGGGFSYFVDRLRNRDGWQKIVTGIISFIAYIIALWLGTVLGLDGTMWD